MKTTEVLARLSNYLKFVNIPGNILNGKHRIWPRLSVKHKRHLMRRIDMEIGNMKQISTPFIDEEKSKLYHQYAETEKKKLEIQEKFEKTRSNKNKMEDRLMSDHLDHLKFNRVWE